jgi:hypothetical protein
MAGSVGGSTRQGRGASLTGIVVAAIKARRTLHEQTWCVRAGSSGVVRGGARPGPGHGVERCRLPGSVPGHQRMCGARIRRSAPVDADAVAGVIPAVIPGLLMVRAWFGPGLTDQFEARGVRAGVLESGPGTSPLVTASRWGRRRPAGSECRRGEEAELGGGGGPELPWRESARDAGDVFRDWRAAGWRAGVLGHGWHRHCHLRGCRRADPDGRQRSFEIRTTSGGNPAVFSSLSPLAVPLLHQGPPLLRRATCQSANISSYLPESIERNASIAGPADMPKESGKSGCS